MTTAQYILSCTDPIYSGPNLVKNRYNIYHNSTVNEPGQVRLPGDMTVNAASKQFSSSVTDNRARMDQRTDGHAWMGPNPPQVNAKCDVVTKLSVFGTRTDTHMHTHTHTHTQGKTYTSSLRRLQWTSTEFVYRGTWRWTRPANSFLRPWDAGSEVSTASQTPTPCDSGRCWIYISRQTTRRRLRGYDAVVELDWTLFAPVSCVRRTETLTRPIKENSEHTVLCTVANLSAHKYGYDRLILHYICNIGLTQKQESLNTGCGTGTLPIWAYVRGIPTLNSNPYINTNPINPAKHLTQLRI